ncbi:hypothetical protein NDI45_29580 [Leptolyngbya sp. GB1-A1]|uniref:hypothetical protein n=1 Tax=Leptolyngbya sp. GB1-A1 TaxID=2933908 RepID=UPI0032976305
MKAAFEEPGVDLPSDYLDNALSQIESFINSGTADELGAFIEATTTSTLSNRDIHNNAHGLIGFVEARDFPNDPRLIDASMSSTVTAHHNEHFWGLHGWTDEIFARLQRKNGEIVDQSPLLPSHDHGITESMRGSAELIFRPPLKEIK